MHGNQFLIGHYKLIFIFHYKLYVCKIVGCFNCEQVQFATTHMQETGQVRHSQEVENLLDENGGYV